MSSRSDVGLKSSRVAAEGPEYGFGDLTFEEAASFGAAVSSVGPSLVVVAARSVDDCLNAGGEMDRVVELPVASPSRRCLMTSPLVASIGAVPA